MNYDSFGNVTSGSASTRYTYTGREADVDTGLMYYRARFYDPQQGRFISEDPIGFDGGLNLYVYVENNPLKFRDPSGLCPQQSTDVEKPCRTRSDDVNRDIDQIGKFLGATPGTPYLGRDYAGAGFDPKGQSFDVIKSLLERNGFSEFINLNPIHLGTRDFKGSMPDGLYYHVNVSFPVERKKLYLGYYFAEVPDSSKPTPLVTIHCHGTDPGGQAHVVDWLHKNFKWPGLAKSH